MAAILVFLISTVVPVELLTETTLVLVIATFFLGIFVSNNVLSSGRFGQEIKDPKEIVIDEFAGYYISILGFAGQVIPMIIAFVLFRIFDNWKPWPISRLEQIPGGWGIMLDDIAAGIYALVLTHLIIFLRPF